MLVSVIVHGETFGNLKLTTPCLLAARLFKRRKSNTIVLSGLSGSGKTILFYQVSIRISRFFLYFYRNSFLVRYLISSFLVYSFTLI